VASNEGQQDSNAGAWNDHVVELESTGELDGNGVAVYRPRRDGGAGEGAAGALVHRSVKRRLLPYQVALCQALGVSEDDYNEFLAVQRDWTISQDERFAIVRADPVSIVLAVVGIIFQVVGALLAPKPEKPKQTPQTRNQRFSPRYGFNSTQELAVYGEVIPIVYCNDTINSRGVVRVTTQLLWSAVESEGSAQFMQLLLLVGAAQVQRISFQRTAFGQLPLSQIQAANTWVYYDANGGAVRFNSKVVGDNKDPARDGLGASDIVHQIKDGDAWRVGYSQAFTPTSKTAFGCYSAIPINVELGERRQSGRMRWAENLIQIAANDWDATNGRWRVGDKFRLVFRQAQDRQDNLAQEAAKDMRYQMVTLLDRGSTYQLGSAQFKINFISDNLNLDKGDVFAQLECVQAGRRPTISYSKKRATNLNEDDPANADRITAEDDSFYTKCLVKADTASYQTVTSCDYVKLNIRARLFRRIQGRAKTYGGEDAPEGYRYSDNGIKGRMAFWAIRYRQVGAGWQRVPAIFAMRRAADTDNFVTIKFETNGAPKKWEFEFSPILDPAAEIADNGYPRYAFVENGGRRSRVVVPDGRFAFYGSIEGVAKDGLPNLRERGPIFTNEWDFFSPRSDTEMQGSFDQGPEFQLVNVTEQQQCNVASTKYKDMSLLAIHTYSGAGVQDLRNVTAYVREGKSCWKISEVGGVYRFTSDSTSWAPDIFADTVLDKDNGVGRFVNPEGIDWEGLSKAKRFCRNNGLGCRMHMDGVLAEQTSWREFWVEVAPYSLLEFARINGRETLLPAVPVNGDGSATRELEISALFNQGNILPDSYREEFLDYGDNTQDLIATVIYRDTTTDDMFPRNDSITIKLSDTRESDSVRQTFDISDWVTQRKQAELYGKLLCQQRRHLKKGIEFKTIPSDTPIGPGEYIFVDLGLNKWDDIRSGVVEAGGKLNVPLTMRIPDGNYLVLTYRSGGRTKEQRVDVIDGVAPALADREGHLFVLGRDNAAKRVFRVNEVSMDESGETTVKAIEYPTERVGASIRSLVHDFRDSLFTEIQGSC